MEFLVLGPLRVAADGRLIEISAAKPRSILGVLLVNVNQVVSADRLLEEVWEDRQPSGGVKTLQYHVSKLRDVLEPKRGRGEEGRIGTVAGGYVLRAESRQLDARRFEHLAGEGAELLSDDDLDLARERLEEALGLWRGGPFEDFRYESFAQGEIARLEELRLVCVENRIAADLELGRHRELVGELRDLTTRLPLRERLWGQLMTALYRSDQQAEALRAYQSARTVLGEELGIEPNTALQRLEEQILLHELPFEAPPAMPPDGPSLPARSDSFVGRTHDVRTVESVLERHRLVTLTGPGGVGKTSMALEVARNIANRFADGVRLVELGPLTESGFVVGEFAAALGVRGDPTRSLLEVLVVEMPSRDMLLVVDSCEHLVGEAGRVVGALLTGCPRLVVIATSRELLRIAGEHVWPVPPLGLPSRPDEPSAAEARESDAVRLFVERAQQIHPGFELTDSNVGDVVTLCYKLDGIPLALELAAARMRVLTPSQAVRRLDDRFAFLIDEGVRMDRHRSLQAAIDWSHDLLEPAERLLLRRLAVFEGSFDLEAVAAVGSGDGIDRSEVERLFSRLVDASLVHLADSSSGQRRFRMLESVHEFALAELADAGEERATRLRHADHFVALIPSTEELGYDSAQGAAALETLAAEQDNYRAALAWAVRVGDGERALRLGARLWHHWDVHGIQEEALAWLPAVLEVSRSWATAERVGVLMSLGFAFAYSPRRQECLPIIEELISLTARLDDPLLAAQASLTEAAYLDADSRPRESIAVIAGHLDVLRKAQHPALSWPLRNVVWSSILVGEYDEASRLLDELESLLWEVDQPAQQARAIALRGMLAHHRGDLQGAERLLAAGLAELRRRNRINELANLLRELTQVSLATGRLEEAIARAGELIANGRRMGNDRDIAEGHVLLARAELGLGRRESAAAAAAEALRITLDSRDDWTLALLSATVGQIAREMGDAATAVALHASAETRRSRIGFALPKARSRELENEFTALRTSLGSDRFQSIWDDGTSLDQTQLAVTIRTVLRSGALASQQGSVQT